MRVLVLGASGAIGQFLLPRLTDAGHEVLAASRRARAARPLAGPMADATAGVCWSVLDLHADGRTAAQWPGHADAVLSAGPLDLAWRWLQSSPLRPPRVIAFGSTSVHSKRDSVDPAERAVAARLQAAERGLSEWASQIGSALTVLRPTLVYGAGLDRSLSRLAALGARLGWVPIPTRANGLRQPVHADDLAAAAVAALHLPHTPHAGYDLPGGETLSYRDMVARVLDCLQPRPRLIDVPLPLLRAGLGVAHLAGRLRDAHTAILLRTRTDLVFDAAPALADLDYRPRMFTVTAAMLSAPPAGH